MSAPFRIFLLVLLASLPLRAQQKENLSFAQLETRFIPETKTFTGKPYLRFDPVKIEDSVLNAAFSKQMVLQDHHLNLWFRTDDMKLVRFDGYYYKCFASEKFSNLAEAENGQFFAPTNRGIALLDTIRDEFVHYPVDMKNAVHIWASTPVYRNRVFLTIGSPFNSPSPSYQFDLDRREYTPVNPRFLENGFTGQIEATDSIYMARPFTVDHLGNVWGQVDYRKEGYLGYYDRERNCLVWYPLEKARCLEFVGSDRPHQALDLYWTWAEPNGRYIWTGGWWHTGLLRLDTYTRTIRQYYFEEIGFNRAYDLVSLKENRLLIQSESGIFIFDPNTENVHLYLHIPDNPYSPQAAPPHPMKLTRNGSLWIGNGNDNTFRVLNLDRQYFRKIPEAITKRGIVRPIEKLNQKLYYGFRTGAYRGKGINGVAEYDERTGEDRVLYQETDGRIRAHMITQAMRDTSDGSILFTGSVEGGAMFRWFEKTGKFELIKEKIDGLPFTTDQIADIREMARDPDGNIWFSTVSLTTTLTEQAHLFYYNPRTRKFKGYHEGTLGLPAIYRIRSMICDQRGIIWICYQNKGIIAWFDPRTERAVVHDKIEQFDDKRTSSITRLIEDRRRSVIWIVALQDGLWKYDLKANTWQQTLPDPVINMQLAADGKLWLKTFSGIVRYNPDTGERREFGKEYEFGNFQYGSFTRTADDELFYEKFRFYPSDIPDDAEIPKATLSFIRVFDKEIPESAGLNYRKQLTLNHSQNFFSVGFAIMSPFRKEKNTYAYKLDGFHQDWVSAGHQPLAVFTNVPPGSYRLLVKGADADGLWSDERSIGIVIKPPYWQTWWFRLLAALAITAALYGIYRYRLAQQTLKSRLEAESARNEQREAELSRRVAETEISALRAQMNPHFIFNCLNSVQYYIARQEMNEASEYLNKFSKLIRLVLENSKSEQISLVRELETLRLYLEMEIVRFEEKIKFNINVDPEIDQESIDVPPLLLQPFVENSIWHGLMQKDEGGRIDIDISLSLPNLLRIVLTDDGVGRQKSAELKSKSATTHKSFGMKLTTERMELISQVYKIRTEIEIIDLKGEDGASQGTRIILLIPV